MSIKNGNNIIGNLDEEVIKKLKLNRNVGQPIFIGDGNIEHMKNVHPDDFKKYADKIKEIIKEPDYVGLHPTKKSIEYFKVFKNEEDEMVLLAVRASGNGKLFVRSLYKISSEQFKDYLKKDTVKPYK